MIITATISGRAVPSVYRDLRRAFSMTYRMKFYLLPPSELSRTAALSGLTGIVGIFFFKDYLDLPAEFLAMLGFGAGASPRVKKITLIPSLIICGSGNRSSHGQ